MERFDLAKFVETHTPKNGRFFTIAIDGCGGSGKSSLLQHLEGKLLGATLVQGDGYFEPVNDRVVWGVFNEARFNHDVIEPLKTGNSFIYKPYDWHAEQPFTDREAQVQEIFCLERCYSFNFGLDWDLKI